MNNEDFHITLKPGTGSVWTPRYDELDLHNSAREVHEVWPEFRYEHEIPTCAPARHYSETNLIWETSESLFHVAFGMSEGPEDEVSVSMWFSYGSSRALYLPFCDVAAFVMRRFNLVCHCAEGYPPDLRDAPREIEDPDRLRDILVPSMDYGQSHFP